MADEGDGKGADFIVFPNNLLLDGGLKLLVRVHSVIPFQMAMPIEPVIDPSQITIISLTLPGHIMPL